MKPRHIAAAVLLTFLPLTTVSMPAFTQEDPLTLQARARFKEGVDAFDKGKYEEARLAFLQAYTLKKHPAVLLNLAQSSAKSNHNLDAAKYFQQFLKEATTATPQQRKDAESGLAEVRQKLGRIEVVAPPGTEISLDDQGKVGTTPMDVIEVEPGQHTVKSPTQSATVIAVVGQKVEAKLGPTSSSSLPPGPTVVTPVPSTPAAPQETPPPEKPTEDGTVHARSKNLLAPPENMTPVWIGVGVAGAGLLGFVAFGIFRNDAQSKADQVEAKIVKAAQDRNIPERGACSNASVQAAFASPCATLKKNNDLVDTNATVANISLGIGIAGAVFAGVWYLAAPKREEGPTPPATGRAPSRSVFMPYANYDGGGISFAGEF